MEKFAHLHLLITILCIFFFIRLNLAMQQAPIDDAKMQEMFEQIGDLLLEDDEGQQKQLQKQKSGQSADQSQHQQLAKAELFDDKNSYANISSKIAKDKLPELEGSSSNPVGKSVKTSRQKPGKLVIFSNSSRGYSNKQNLVTGKKEEKDEKAKKYTPTAKGDELERDSFKNLIDGLSTGETKSTKGLSPQKGGTGELKSDNPLDEKDPINKAKSVDVQFGPGSSINSRNTKIDLKKGGAISSSTSSGKVSSKAKTNAELNEEKIARMEAELKQKRLELEKSQKLQRKQKLQNDAALASQSGMKSVKPSAYGQELAKENLADELPPSVENKLLGHGSSIGEEFGPREGISRRPSSPGGKEPSERPERNTAVLNEEDISRKNIVDEMKDIKQKGAQRDAADFRLDKDPIPMTTNLASSKQRREHCFKQIGNFLDKLQLLNEESFESKLSMHYANMLFGQIGDNDRNQLYWRIDSFLLIKEIQTKWALVMTTDRKAATSAAKGGAGGKAIRRGKNKKKTLATKETTVAATTTTELTDQQLEVLTKLAEDQLLQLPANELIGNMVMDQDIVERIAKFWLTLKDREKMAVLSEGGQVGKLCWTEIQLLNLEAMKTLLVVDKHVEGQTTNELAKEFEQRLFREEDMYVALFFAKGKMRQICGERMFAELELQEPQQKDNGGIREHLKKFSDIKKMVRKNKFEFTKGTTLYAGKLTQWLPKEHWELLKQILVLDRTSKQLRALNAEQVKRLAELLADKNSQQEKEVEAFVELFKKQTMALEGEKSASKSEKGVYEEHFEKVEQNVKKEFKEEEVAKERKTD